MIGSVSGRSISRQILRHGIRQRRNITIGTASRQTNASPLRMVGGIGIAGGAAIATLHSVTGSADDFYDYRFETQQDPDDLASFYGGEELMELFCIFPIVGQMMMRNAHFDDQGNVQTLGFPGKMTVSMVFSDESNEETGQTDWFNKRERFTNTLFGVKLWDMVVNFGFRTKEDGTVECYHFGEYFHGSAPVLSQAMLLIFKLHARWVAWSTEHHINHFAFGSALAGDEDVAEEFEHASRANMPLFLLKNYAWSDLKAMVFGTYDSNKPPSFLLKERDEEGRQWDELRERHLGEMAKLRAVRDEIAATEELLPFQRKSIQIQIAEDIEDDRTVIKSMLAHRDTKGFSDVKSLLVKHHTIALKRRSTVRKGGTGEEIDIYKIAKDLAVERAQMRKENDEEDGIKTVTVNPSQIVRKMTRQSQNV
ncbi:hypothetical protein THAOC_03016 [Thalassiosira oceanica]|uniref:Uncharacterized protein n=1 Tax=Thalassiosira oceanica TaxID=159749 RepID=K0TCX6_THAOC|nr:hypothetical protein THAOC_03016 [Thalassiosira oceanica]|mmetsp:Transcript_17828/g.41602  ORF Transcript_17828/g.41602 Transcript_17828/m.41602 type:complete len:423 (-) Transcript_17828:73-1341(-)|eukprot:EJK75265.1 hypothetical protein THAOC_03016 [Thalassiosira oceanica]